MDWKNHEIHQENACHQHDRRRGCGCACGGAQRDGRSRASGGARTGAERAGPAGAAVPPAARNQSGRRDAAHPGPHLDARQRPGCRPRAARPRARCRRGRAGTGTRRNGVGHSSAACGSGRSPGPCDRAGTAAQNLLPSGEMNIPNMPFLPVPLPQQVSFPGDLAALMPSGLLPGAKPAAAPVAPAAAPAPAPAAPAPAAAAPAAPAPGAGLAPLVMPLSALP